MKRTNGHAEADALTSAPAIATTLLPAQTQQAQDSNALAPARWTAAIDEAIARRDAITQAMRELMKEGVDFGKIAGSDRPTLLQPGAEKLCVVFGIRIKYEVEVAIEDFTGANYNGTAFFYYRIRGTATHNGEFLGEGIGSCHLWESKYKWRQGERTCPHCKKAAIIKGRDEYGGGWLCFARKGGCGAKFADKDEAIAGQAVGRVLNPDLLDAVNTVLKIALKRSKIGTTINATGASDCFTQDLEDTGGEQDAAPPAAAPAPKPPQSQAAPAPPAPAAPAQNPWANTGAMKAAFHDQRKRVGDFVYTQLMGQFSVRGPEDFRDVESAVKAYQRLCAQPNREVA